MLFVVSELGHTMKLAMRLKNLRLHRQFYIESRPTASFKFNAKKRCIFRIAKRFYKLLWIYCGRIRLSVKVSPNSHRKCRRNVPRIFDVCSELKSDCKSYFGFLVDKFSEAVNTEITTSSIIAWSDCRSWSQAKKQCRQFFLLPLKKMPDRWLSKLIIPLLQIQNNLNKLCIFHVEYPQYVSTRLSVGTPWTILTAGHLSFWDCDRQSDERKTLQILVCTRPGKNRPLQIHNNF